MDEDIDLPPPQPGPPQLNPSGITRVTLSTPGANATTDNSLSDFESDDDAQGFELEAGDVQTALHSFPSTDIKVCPPTLVKPLQ
jgi:hypothetical protein